MKKYQDHCNIQDCDQKFYGLGYCKTHYTHNRLYGDPLHYGRPPNRKLCKVYACGWICEKDYCSRHLDAESRFIKVLNPNICAVVWCEKLAIINGFCKKHVWYYADRDRALRFDYGVTLADYEDIYIKQEGKCAICKLSGDKIRCNRKQVPLLLDHCHQTGKIRGLLCNPCNRTLGFLGDNVQSARRFLEYLKNAT